MMTNTPDSGRKSHSHNPKPQHQHQQQLRGGRVAAESETPASPLPPTTADQPGPSRRRVCCSVNLVAAALAAAFIVATAAVVVGVTTAFSIEAASDFARRYTVGIATAGQTKVRDIVAVTALQEQGLRFGLESGAYPQFLDNRSRGAPKDAFLNMMAPRIPETAFRMVYAGYGLADELWFHCLIYKLQEKEFWCEISDPFLQVNVSNRMEKTRLTYRFRNMSFVGILTSLTTPYNPTTRAWYRLAMADGPTGPVRMSVPFLHYLFDRPIVTINAPMVNRTTSAIFGVTSVALDLVDLSSFLHALPATTGTLTALTDNNGLLLGLSDLRPLHVTYERNGTMAAGQDAFTGLAHNASGFWAAGACEVAEQSLRIVCRFGTNNSGNALLRAAAAEAPSLFVGAQQGEAVGVSRLALPAAHGGVHYAGSAQVTAAGLVGMQWGIVTIVPETDVTAGIVAGRNLAIGLAAAATVVAAAVCTAALFVLLRPLRLLAERMITVSTLRQEALLSAGGGTSTRSGLREIAAIEAAFGTLFGQLMRARSFLPGTLLAQLDASNKGSASGGEDDDDGEDDEGDIIDMVCASSQGSATPTSTSLSTARTATAPSSTTGSLSASASPVASREASRRRHQHPQPLHHVHVPTSKHAPHASSSSGGGDALLGAVRSRSITVLALNLRGFHHHMRQAQAQWPLGRPYGALVDALTEAARPSRGVLDSFHGDRFMVTFNAAIPCASHRAAAVAVAGRLLASLAVPITAGVATGLAHVGNMGSDRTRRFANVGPVVPQACVLERLAKAVPVGASTASPSSRSAVLVTQAVADEAQHVALFMFVDAVPLPGADSTATHGRTTGPPDKERDRMAAVPVALLRSLHKHAAADEWMYELQASTVGPASNLVGAVSNALRQALLTEREQATVVAPLEETDTLAALQVLRRRCVEELAPTDALSLCWALANAALWRGLDPAALDTTAPEPNLPPPIRPYAIPPTAASGPSARLGSFYYLCILPSDDHLTNILPSRPANGPFTFLQSSMHQKENDKISGFGS